MNERKLMDAERLRLLEALYVTARKLVNDPLNDEYGLGALYRDVRAIEQHDKAKEGE